MDATSGCGACGAPQLGFSLSLDLLSMPTVEFLETCHANLAVVLILHDHEKHRKLPAYPVLLAPGRPPDQVWTRNGSFPDTSIALPHCLRPV